MISEDEVLQLIRIEGAKHDTILMRNNSGALQDQHGRPVRYGLMNESRKQNKLIKSSDLIGIETVIITQEMVGQTVGIFTAVEVKKSDWVYKGDEREIAQKAFIDFVISKGAKAGFAKSVDDFKRIIGK